MTAPSYAHGACDLPLLGETIGERLRATAERFGDSVLLTCTASDDALRALLTHYAAHGSSDRAVSDPFGGDLDVYRATYEELEREIKRVFDRIAAEQAPGAS